VAAALLGPAATSDATTVTLGPSVPSSAGSAFICEPLIVPCPGITLFQSSLPDVPVVAPADGTITFWRVNGSGSLRLRVLHPTGGGQFTGAGTSEPAAALDGSANSTRLPIRAGDSIGVDLASSPPSRVGFTGAGQIGPVDVFNPALVDGPGSATPSSFDNESLFLSADIVLAPFVASVAPASGPTVGGEAVTITGSFLDGATQVLFGSLPASSFTVDSAGQITAIAPAGPAGTVDVRVEGPGGTSAISPGDRYTFVTPPPPSDRTPPVLSSLALAPSSFVAYNAGESVASATVGTRVTYQVSEPATVTFSVTRKAPGRKRGGKCIKGGRKGKRCKATVTLPGGFTRSVSGADSFTFTGRLRAKALRPGDYGLRAVAADAAGNSSQPSSHPFRVLR
jgi:hypothetical protein